MEEAQSGNQLYLQNETAIDLEMFDGLYRRYHQAVYANICKMVHEPQAAEDILQEVFLALWENRQKLDAGQVAGWLFVVSYNKAATFLKKKLKEPAVLLHTEELPEPFVSSESTDEDLYHLKLSIVEEAVSHLPARKKEVFRLCRFEGKSYDEVATLLGISVVSVRDYLKQSTQFIKKYVSLHYPHFEATALTLLVVYLGT
ncbi:MAG: sigma-70 family RNA polymerase sigma factor [Chitinophagaceae bacterium]